MSVASLNTNILMREMENISSFPMSCEIFSKVLSAQSPEHISALFHVLFPPHFFLNQKQGF